MANNTYLEDGRPFLSRLTQGIEQSSNMVQRCFIPSESQDSEEDLLDSELWWKGVNI